MRRVALLLVGTAGVAHADDPRDLFGLTPKPAAKIDCSDGKTFGCAQATDPLADDDVPYALRTWLPASYVLSLPTADATQTAVAGYALGAGVDGGFGGATASENRWTIEGAPAEDAQNGGADTVVPVTFLEGLYVTAGGFSARDRTSTGGVIDARLKRGTAKHEVDAQVWLGWTAPARHRPALPASYSVRTGVVDPGPDASMSLVATGPLAHDWWYAAGIAPSLRRTQFGFTAHTLVDDDQNGIPDGFPGVITTDLVERDTKHVTTYEVPMMARVGWDRGPHHLELSLVGEAFTESRFVFNSTLQAGGVDRSSLVGDGIATWKSNWQDTHLRVQAAWHRSHRSESARDPSAADTPQLLSAYVPDPLAQDPALGGACSDMTGDRYPQVTNCPIPTGWFASGGAGPLVETTADSPSLTADLSHREGNHVLRVGATGEDTRLVIDTRFTGGEQIRSLFPGHMSERRFLDPNTPCEDTGPCTTVDTSELAYRTRYTAAYAEDTWHVAPDIQVDGGLRWELMWVGSAAHFSNELAPRLGAAWAKADGTARVWTSMGRSFSVLPAGLGSVILQRDRYVDETTSPFGTSRSVETGLPFATARGLAPITQDEVTAGVELSPLHAMRLTGWAQGRSLRRGLALTPDGFDNPGRDLGQDASRDTALFGAEVATAPTGKLVLRIGYMYGHTEGSWTGLASTDFEFVTQNLVGALPTDPGHRTYIEGERSGRVGPVKLTVALRLSLASGRPRSALGDSDDGIIYLVPRGSLGRGPLLTQTNARVAATWHGVDVLLDVFNAFDHRDATTLDEVYAAGSIHPIVGGSASDLVFLRTETGTLAARSPGFLVPTGYQSPVSVVLGVRTRF